MFIELYLMQRY